MFLGLLFCFLAFSLENVFGQNKSDELVGVIIVFRHGARTIIEPYPNDPYANESLWPAGFGQLTNLGKLQHLELGQWFRNRYNSFLPLEYSEKDLYIRSTDVDRTLMSAEANLAGLYPPKGRQVWDYAIPWQPIPIHTRPVIDDPVLSMQKSCPKYNHLVKKLWNSEEIQDIVKKNLELINYVRESTGAEIINFDEFEYIYNTLTIEKNMNFTLPDWTKKVYPYRMKPLADFSFGMPCYTKEMARLKTGPFFNNLINALGNITESHAHFKNYIKLYIYSGHDTTIANVLKALDLFEYHSPPYASTILFEVRKSVDYYVNVFYKNTSEPREMVLNGCSRDCPLNDFLNVVQPISVDVDKWTLECQNGFWYEWEIITNSYVAAILVVATITGSIIFIFMVMKKIREKSRRDKNVYYRLPDDDVESEKTTC